MKKLFLLLLLLNVSFAHAEATDTNLLQQQPYDIVLGNQAAPVTIIEYFSLSCPHCADFQKNIFPAINEKYVETGKVIFLARPYAVDEPSLLGSRLLQCVPKNKYYPFIKVLLAMQEKWVLSVTVNMVKEKLLTIANVGGFSKEEFDACFAQKTNEETVLSIRKAAEEELKVDVIPIFFINGVEVRGAGKAEDLIKVIDEQLENANKVK
jgi:protein-disulfide isomerase